MDRPVFSQYYQGSTESVKSLLREGDKVLPAERPHLVLHGERGRRVRSRVHVVPEPEPRGQVHVHVTHLGVDVDVGGGLWRFKGGNI